jgi:hypothetical protein
MLRGLTFCVCVVHQYANMGTSLPRVNLISLANSEKRSCNIVLGHMVHPEVKQELNSPETRDGIHQIVIRTLSGFRYLCQQLAYLVLSRIFPIASQMDDSLESYQDYSAKSVGKQGGEFLIAVLVKS